MVSVIIPTHNCAHFLPEAVASTRRQSVSPGEILVIDDGSTDDTQAVLRRIHGPDLRVERLERSGVSTARNVGLELARGDHVAFLDADDRWRPRYLEKQLAALNSDPKLVASVSNFVRFNNRGVFPADQYTFYPELNKLPKLHAGVSIARDGFRELIGWGNHPTWVQATVFRSDACRNIRFDADLKYCEDALFCFEVFARGGVAFLDEPLAEVRRHPGNVTRGVTDVYTKLVALDRLKRLVLSDEELRALEARTGRQLVVAGLARISEGRYEEARRAFARAVTTRGARTVGLRYATMGPFLAALHVVRSR